MNDAPRRPLPTRKIQAAARALLIILWGGLLLPLQAVELKVAAPKLASGPYGLSGPACASPLKLTPAPLLPGALPALLPAPQATLPQVQVPFPTALAPAAAAQGPQVWGPADEDGATLTQTRRVLDALDEQLSRARSPDERRAALDYLYFGVETPASPVLPDALASDPAELAADKLLRSDLLFTIGGVKPFSADPLEGDHETIKRALQSRAFGNPDIEFFLVRTDSQRGIVQLAAVNRRAVERLSRDRTAITVLRRHGISMPQDPDGWIGLFKKAVDAGGFLIAGPEWANLVVGIALGFPPIEAERYANANHGWPDSRRGVAPRRRAGFEQPAYARFTEQELERDRYFVESTGRLMDNYVRLVRAGRRPTDILKASGELTEDLPPFPERHLLPAR